MSKLTMGRGFAWSLCKICSYLLFEKLVCALAHQKLVLVFCFVENNIVLARFSGGVIEQSK